MILRNEIHFYVIRSTEYDIKIGRFLRLATLRFYDCVFFYNFVLGEQITLHNAFMICQSFLLINIFNNTKQTKGIVDSIISLYSKIRLDLGVQKIISTAG